jgi:hypothetical protein
VGGAKSRHGRPYDGHTLPGTLEQAHRIKRRSALEPVIDHLKSGHRLGKNFLKGIEGVQYNAILAGIGFNIAKLLAAICLFSDMQENCLTIGALLAQRKTNGTQN